ncbi:MAG: hypothetical protein KDA89_17585 [Planctomycetaceae bacterium]|nr:hypothetical protein [Planctomycetaceae bacterium]
MSFSESQIEVITQSVLRELSSRGIAVANAALTGESLNAPPEAKTQAAVEARNVLASGCRLNDRVITEEILAGYSASGQVTVRSDAVITPSGHDYIRRSGLTVVRGVVGASRSGTGTLLAVGNCATAISAAAAAGWKTVEAGCEWDAARKATPLLNKERVVCCGGEASVTACLLNRNADVRAAVVTPASDTDKVIRKMNPQVVCLNHSGWSFVAVTRLLRSLASVSLAAPEKWRELR